MKNNLKKYRIKSGYNQEEAAHAIGLASSNRLSEWEQGQSFPNIINLFKLSTLYKVDPTKLYSEDFILAKSQVKKRPRVSNKIDQFPITLKSEEDFSNELLQTEEEAISQLANILVEGFIEMYSKKIIGED